jgi:hypothetical protein
MISPVAAIHMASEIRALDLYNLTPDLYCVTILTSHLLCVLSNSIRKRGPPPRESAPISSVEEIVEGFGQ